MFRKAIPHKRKIIKKYISTFLCVVVIGSFVFGGLLFPRKSQAISSGSVVSDIGNTMVNTVKWIGDKIMWIWDNAAEEAYKALQKAGSVSFKSIFQNALNKIAYDSATYLGSGGKGQKPMFITEGWGEYLGNIADEAAGEYIEALGKEGMLGEKFNLCEPNFNFKLQIGLGLVDQTRPKAPACTFTEMTKNWDKALKKGNFLNDFKDMFKPASNEFGIAMKLQTGIIEDKQKKIDAQTYEREEGGGWLDRKEVSGDRESTPGLAKDRNFFNLQIQGNGFGKDFGDVFTNAANVFLHQYFITLFMTQLANLGKGQPHSTNPYTGDLEEAFTQEEAGPPEGGAAEIEKNLQKLIKPDFTVQADFDLLSQLSTCQDETSAGPMNCVINSSFSSAITERLTLREAVEKGYLYANGKFGFEVQSTDTGGWISYGREPSYRDGYPYRTMLILRKYRILPVGWELAAQYIRRNAASSQSCTLGDMMACFDPNDNYDYSSDNCNPGNWCRGLVDPDWVLKAPEHICKRQGPGAEYIYYESTEAVSFEQPKLIVMRNEEYCADEQSCILEDKDGSCRLFGYCTEEKRKWDFGKTSCDQEYNTCQSFRAPDGKKVSYLENTLNYDFCSADNVGCTPYCEEYSVSTAIASLFTIAQGASSYVLPATFSTPENAASFYNYNLNSSGNPALRSAAGKDKSIIFLHHNTLNDIFSIGFVHDFANDIDETVANCETSATCASIPNCDCNGGNITLRFTEISPGNLVAVNDDNNEGGIAAGVDSINNNDTWLWTWAPGDTDGGMIQMPDGNWSVTIEVASYAGILPNNWVVAYDGGEIPLDMNGQVTISRSDLVGSYNCSMAGGDELYLDRDAEDCVEEDEGCREFIRTKIGLGTNLIQNSGFESEGIMVGDSISIGGGTTDYFDNWPVAGPSTAYVVDSISGKVHSGGKSLHFESGNRGLFSNNYGVDSVFPVDFEFEIGQVYTLSAWIYVVSGRPYIAMGNNVTTPTWDYRATTTTTGSWERVSLTILNDPTIQIDEFIIYGAGAEFYVDDVQLEIGIKPTYYKPYRGENVVYEKILPDYLAEECYTIPGTDYTYRNNAPSACYNYSRLCNAEEAGCELYTASSDNMTVPAITEVNDYCPSHCVGYDDYLQREAIFDSERMNLFVPSTAKNCSIDAVGCDEFTNLDQVNNQGEAQQYYTYLRQCIKPDPNECDEFYTWEGSNETGYQLRVFSLELDDDSDDAALDPAYRYDHDPAVIENDYNECTAAIYGLPVTNLDYNPDCREFYNTNGEISYHLYSRTITCSDDCYPYRRSEDNIVTDALGGNIIQADCDALSQLTGQLDVHFDNGTGECHFCKGRGEWNNQYSACVYMGMPNESIACSASQAGCREYSGNTGNNMRVVFTSDFEGGNTDGWAGDGATAVEPTNNNIYVGERSMRVYGGSFQANIELGSAVQAGKSYVLTFLADRDTATQIDEIGFSNGTDNSTFTIDFYSGGSLINGWQIYKYNIEILDHEVDPAEYLYIRANGDFYLDSVKLIEVIDRYYVIKNTWEDPERCSYNIMGDLMWPSFNLGCEEYYDREGQAHYLHNMTTLCQNSAVGCEEMIDTHNYSNYEQAIWNDDDNSWSCNANEPDCEYAPADNMIYAVYNEENSCDSDAKGCQRLGEPYRYGNVSLYDDAFKANDPDRYTGQANLGGILCSREEVGCEEWKSDDGISWFKDPGDQTCEWRAEQGATSIGGPTDKKTDWGWFRTAVKRCDMDLDGESGISDPLCENHRDCGISGAACGAGVPCAPEEICISGQCHYRCLEDKSDYVCETSIGKTIGNDGSRVITPTWDTDFNNWAGLCPSEQAGCSEYIDPVSNFSINLVGDANFSSPPGTYPAAGCDQYYWCDNAGIFEQEIVLEQNYMYRFSGINDTAGWVNITCANGSVIMFDLVANNWGNASTSITIQLNTPGPDGYENTAYFYNTANNNDCTVSVNNINPGMNVDFVEVREVVIDYQIKQELDRETCNGIVDRGDGCVLFNERKAIGGNGESMIYTNLDYNADISPDMEIPAFCTPGDCDTNELIKVRPDRDCDNWLSCTSFGASGMEGNICLGIGICDKLNKNSECERFLNINPNTVINQTYRPGIHGIRTPGDIIDMSGHVKVGYEGVVINRYPDNKYPLGFMEPYGGQTSITSASFEKTIDYQEASSSPTMHCRLFDLENDPPHPDCGDPDHPYRWACYENEVNNTPSLAYTKCEVIDDAIENELEQICFVRDRQDSCMVYAPDGKNYLKLVADTNGPARVESDYVEVDSETDYVFSYYVNTRNINRGGGSTEISTIDIEFYDSTNATIPATIIHERQQVRQGWELKRRLFTTPPGADYLRFFLRAGYESELPTGSIYYDHLQLLQALRVHEGGDDDEDFAVKECRLYPRADSLSCDYYEGEIRYRGWTGYCLENDRYPGWEHVCLQWWSIPHEVDNLNSRCGDEIVEDEEDCECPMTAAGDPTFNCDANALAGMNNTGGSVSNQYRCINCIWQGGFCGDNYTDALAPPTEECDWHDDSSLGENPNTNPFTGQHTDTHLYLDCLELAHIDNFDAGGAAVGVAGGTNGLFGDIDLTRFIANDGHPRFVKGTLRCNSSSNQSSYFVASSTDWCTYHVGIPGAGCDDRLGSGSHTAQQCLNLGGEVVRQDGVTIITNLGNIDGDPAIEGELVARNMMGTDAFCKFSGFSIKSTDVNAICATVAGAGWLAYIDPSTGRAWTAQGLAYAQQNCAPPSNEDAECGSPSHPNYSSNHNNCDAHNWSTACLTTCYDGDDCGYCPGPPPFPIDLCPSISVSDIGAVTEIGCY